MSRDSARYEYAHEIPVANDTASCPGKHAYPSKAIADVFRGVLSTQYQTPQKSYRCLCCHKWHLTRHLSRTKRSRVVN